MIRFLFFVLNILSSPSVKNHVFVEPQVPCGLDSVLSIERAPLYREIFLCQECLHVFEEFFKLGENFIHLLSFHHPVDIIVSNMKGKEEILCCRGSLGRKQEACVAPWITFRTNCCLENVLLLL